MSEIKLTIDGIEYEETNSSYTETGIAILHGKRFVNFKPKEKDIPKDYEVLTYTKRENEQAEIYSVKRLMDETILQIGDEVTPQYFFETYKIKSFRIDGAYMMANFEPPINNNPNGFCNINYLRKVKPKEPLFTTNIDQVEIFEGEYYFQIDKKFNLIYLSSVRGGVYTESWTNNTSKSKDKAEEWLILNKPIEVSCKGLMQFLTKRYGYQNSDYENDVLKEFFKSKINP